MLKMKNVFCAFLLIIMCISGCSSTISKQQFKENDENISYRISTIMQKNEYGQLKYNYYPFDDSNKLLSVFDIEEDGGLNINISHFISEENDERFAISYQKNIRQINDATTFNYMDLLYDLVECLSDKKLSVNAVDDYLLDIKKRINENSIDTTNQNEVTVKRLNPKKHPAVYTAGTNQYTPSRTSSQALVIILLNSAESTS